MKGIVTASDAVLTPCKVDRLDKNGLTLELDSLLNSHTSYIRKRANAHFQPQSSPISEDILFIIALNLPVAYVSGYELCSLRHGCIAPSLDG